MIVSVCALVAVFLVCVCRRWVGGGPDCQATNVWLYSCLYCAIAPKHSFFLMLWPRKKRASSGHLKLWKREEGEERGQEKEERGGRGWWRGEVWGGGVESRRRRRKSERWMAGKCGKIEKNTWISSEFEFLMNGCFCSCCNRYYHPNTHTHTHTSIYLLYITFQLYIFMAEMASQSAGYTL